MKNSFISASKLKKMGFKIVGSNVFISKKASFYNPSLISIGSNVRIDDFCILSGKIDIGSNVHLSAGCYLYGGEYGIHIGNHVSISSRCAIYSITDDFSGDFLVGSQEPDNLRNIIHGQVYINDFAVIGTGTTLLPGSKLNCGSAVGAMSLVNGELKPWSLYVGIPCRFLKERSRRCAEISNTLK